MLSIYNDVIQFVEEMPPNAKHIHTWEFENLKAIHLYIWLDSNIKINHYVLPCPLEKFHCNSVYFLSSDSSSSNLDVLAMIQNIDA